MSAPTNLRFHRRLASEQASTLFVVMLTMAVLGVVAGNLMWSANARYHVTYQSASWQEALVAAEAGADFGMAELRKRVVADPADPAFPTGGGSGWTFTNAAGGTYADQGRAFPTGSQAYTVSLHAGEGNAVMRTRVYVDVPGSDASVNFAQVVDPAIDKFMCEQSDRVPYDPQNLFWYRIRSLGIAGVSGPARPSPDSRDNWLRRFSFATDWRTSRPVDNGGPQVSRLVEVVAKPLTNYRNALMADKQHDNKPYAINLNGVDVLVDSYDSRKGPYNSVSNHGEMGNLATNGQVINAGNAVIKGDSMTNNGTTINAANVTGQHRNDFFQELDPVASQSMRSDWAGVINRGTLNVANLLSTVTASTDPTNPTRLHFNQIDLSGLKSLIINSPLNLLDPLNPQSSYVKIYVEGDVRVAGDGSSIVIGDGVNAILYFTGNMDLRGLGIINESFVASHLLIKGIQPPADANGNRPQRSIYLSTSEDFEGSVYAPNHDLTLALQAAGPTLVSSGSQGGVVSDNDHKTEQQINKLRDQVNKDTDDVNKALDKQNQAYAKWQQTPSSSNWNNYLQAGTDVTKAQTKLANDQAKLDKLTKDVQSQADDHLRGYNGIYGSFVGRTIDVLSKTHLHYDEALRQAGPVNHYEIVNWFEDNTSRATVTW